MNAPLKALEGSGGRPSGAKGASDLPALMRQIGRDARTAARVLALAPAAQKNKALAAMAKAIRGGSSAILAANRESFVVVQIETPQAVENAEAIAAVPGVEVLFLGPGDLSLRLGCGPQIDDPQS